MDKQKRRYGNQQPTFSTVGDWSYTRGDAAIKLFAYYRIRFYESQEFELRVFFARNKDGTFASRTICISKPRQNGKSFAVKFYMIWCSAIEGMKVLYSAHHGKTVRKMFKELREFILTNQNFRKKLKPHDEGIYKAAGNEGIYFVDKHGRDFGCIEFQTRTNSGGRGETYGIIVVDEAQELTDEQLEAIKPTTIAAFDVDEGRDPQMIFLGTPPGPKCVGTVFRDYHDRAHSGDLGGIWWIEWAADEIPDLTDRQAVLEVCYKTNPAMGYRIKESSMLDAMDGTRPDGFAREYLGWWAKAALLNHVLTPAEWTACDRAKAPEGRRCYAVKFAPDGSHGVIAVCVKPKDGKPHIELVAVESTASGIQYFADFVIARKSKFAAVVIDGGGAAQTLTDRALAGGVPKTAIMRPGAADVANACSTLVAMVREQAVTHIDEPLLLDAATKTVKRTIGRAGGFGFASTKNGDATIAEAVALSLWAALRTKRDPNRNVVVY